MRLVRALGALIAITQLAHAQPADPYGDPAPSPPPAIPPPPAPPSAPPPTPNTPQDPYVPAPRGADDPVLAEQVARALVTRAQELFDAGVFADAKQLAVEALVRSPKGPAADQARFLLKAANEQLGIVEDRPVARPEPPPPAPVKSVDPEPAPLPPTVEGAAAPRVVATVHAALYGGLIGAALGANASETEQERNAVIGGALSAVVAGLALPRLVDRLSWNEAQIRTAGSGSVWGGLLGGLIADVAETSGSSAGGVLAGAGVGATVGAIAGGALARSNQRTTGDIALVDTFAGIGAAGGFTLGMLMQPVESEAYSLNAILGTAGGVIAGMMAAPRTNTTPRRMLRVAGVAVIGGAVPFLLYAGIRDEDSDSDERLTGALATAGLIGGAYLGFRLTAELDVGKDVLDGTPAVEDAPPSLVGRNSDGRWSLGAIAVQPLSQQLATQSGFAVPLIGGTY
ncbi:MAG: hypothetical protein AB7P03_14830 [Kofleriaceae bacterium]